MMARRRKEQVDPAAQGGSVSRLPSAEIQQLWFRLLQREWSVLVVIPAGPGVSSLEVADALVSVASLHLGQQAGFLDARAVPLAQISTLVVEMAELAASGRKVIIAADSVLQNQASMPLVMASDAILLCVALGKTELEAARATIGIVGRDRIVGSVAVAPGGKKK